MNKKITNCLNCNKPLNKKQISKKGHFCCPGCATSYRQKAHDPDIFEIENKDILYYLLGLIFTDGNLDKEESRITLSLTQENVIRTLYPYFCDTQKRKVYEYTPKNCQNANTCYTILNTNTATISRLKLMTMTPCNTATKNFPDFPIKNVGAFLRGVFDGDGCVTISMIKYGKAYKRISITCAAPVFKDKLVMLLELLGLHPTVVIDSRRKDNEVKTYYICLNKQDEIKQFHDIIYNDAEIWFDYKRQKFE